MLFLLQKFDEDRKFLLKDDADFADERQEAIEKRVPPLNISNINEAELRKLAGDMLKKLKRKYGVIFDMGRTLKKRDYVVRLNALEFCPLKMSPWFNSLCM